MCPGACSHAIGRSCTPSELQGTLLSILAHCPTTADTAQSCLLCCQPEPVPRTLAARMSWFTPGHPCRLPAWPGWRRCCGNPGDMSWPATHGCDTHIGPWQACTPSHPASHRQAASCHVRQLTPWPCCMPDAPAQASQCLQPSCGSLRGAQPAPPACGKGFRAPPCLQPPSPDHRLPSAGLAAASTRVSSPLGMGGM